MGVFFKEKGDWATSERLPPSSICCCSMRNARDRLVAPRFGVSSSPSSSNNAFCVGVRTTVPEVPSPAGALGFAAGAGADGFHGAGAEKEETGLELNVLAGAACRDDDGGKS